MNVIATCREFIGVGTDAAIAKTVKSKKAALPIIKASMLEYLITIESTDLEHFAIEQIQRMCTIKNIELELEKSMNDTLRTNLKPKKKLRNGWLNRQWTLILVVYLPRTT